MFGAVFVRIVFVWYMLQKFRQHDTYCHKIVVKSLQHTLQMQWKRMKFIFNPIREKN